MTNKIAILPGDGIGPEIVTEAEKVLAVLQAAFDFAAEIEHAPVGGAAYEVHGHPLPESTLAVARAADAILLGAVGGPQWQGLERALRSGIPYDDRLHEERDEVPPDFPPPDSPRCLRQRAARDRRGPGVIRWVPFQIENYRHSHQPDDQCRTRFAGQLATSSIRS